MSLKTYFISGFLGAGKTTLLNNLLAELSDKRVGVIMNEFGQVNIDAGLIEYDQGMEISEINNGSIFCTCLSGSFVKNVIELSKLSLDFLLVESSGMARPARVGTIIDQVNKLKNEAIDYQGMITVVDASTYLQLVQSVNAVQEQVAYSDLVIINKIDLVDDTTISDVEKSILFLNPTVQIIKTNYTEVDGILDDNYYLESYKDRQPLLECQQDKGMYKALLRFNDKVSNKNFTKFLEKIVSETYRIKGLVQLANDKVVHIDCAGDDIGIKILEDYNKVLGESQLIFISDNKRLKKVVRDHWIDNFTIDFNID